MDDEARDPEITTTGSLGAEPDAASAGDVTLDGSGPRRTCRAQTGRAYKRRARPPSADH